MKHSFAFLLFLFTFISCQKTETITLEFNEEDYFDQTTAYLAKFGNLYNNGAKKVRLLEIYTSLERNQNNPILIEELSLLLGYKTKSELINDSKKIIALNKSYMVFLDDDKSVSLRKEIAIKNFQAYNFKKNKRNKTEHNNTYTTNCFDCESLAGPCETTLVLCSGVVYGTWMTVNAGCALTGPLAPVCVLGASIAYFAGLGLCSQSYNQCIGQ